jgi:broad specificity phosphatase PhoE
VTPVSESLRKARALVEKGWTRGESYRDGRVCMVGALAAVIRGNPEAMLVGVESGAALKALQQATRETIVWRWNDRQPSKKPVLEAFDRAILIALKEEGNG